MNYLPDYESLRQHEVPAWFHDAKFGIFVHWGLYSVPGWATPVGDIDKQVEESGWEAWFTNNAYAEWYLNTLRIHDSPTHRHHIATYGENFSYDNFIPMFNRAVEKWNPDEWASLFQQAGARYVVLTTKHHDGFLLWDSPRTSPRKPGRYATERDLVGDLTEAVRRYNMRMGLYYSGGLDWSFNETPVRNFTDVFTTIVQSPDFVEYVTHHWHELIDRYAPSVLWNDIGYPAAADLPELFAHYYNSVPEGIINDRWTQKIPERPPASGEMVNPPPATHADFTTPEYASYDHIVERKWESTRGIGHSFGYNQNEGPEDYLSVEELVRSLVDIVSKNGNLLLDVGPMADGTIPDLQRERLLGLGAWLDVNGDAIFGTRPWVTSDGTANGSIPVRYTRKDDALYVILLDTPGDTQVKLDKLQLGAGAKVELLGHSETLTWQQDNDLIVALPALKTAPAHTLKISPAPDGAA